MTPILLIFSAFLSFFFYKNNVAGDFSYLSPPELLSRFDIPRIWQERISEGFGQNTLAILWNWPQDFLYGFLGKLGLPFSVIEIFLFLIPFSLLGIYSISKFLKHYGIKDKGLLAGTIFYLLNSYIILVIDGGQFSIALSYVLLPLNIVLFIESVNKGFRSKVIAALALSGLGYLDIRFIYLFLLIIAFDFLVVETGKDVFDKLLKWSFSGFIALSVFVCLNAYWLLPSLFTGAPTLPEGYSNVTQTKELSFATWKNALFLEHPNWYLNVFGRVQRLNKEFLLIPIFAAAGFLLRKKNRTSVFFVMISLVGIFLVKGSTPPFSGFYGILFSHVPGFVMFRDPTKFYIFITLGYSFLIASLIESKRLAKTFKRLKIKEGIIPVLLILYLLFLIRPVYRGKMTGTLAKPVYENTYSEIWKILENDKSFGRVLWLPTQPPLGYSSPDHPSVEISRIFKKRPFATAIVGSYETNNFLREAPYMGEIFDISGIRYIAYPFPDARRENLKPDNIEYYNAFSEQLKDLGWISDKPVKEPVNFYKTNENTDRFFVTGNSYLVVGPDSIYSELIKVPGFKLKDNAIFFAEEEPGITRAFLGKNYSDVILYDKSSEDLVASMLPGEKFIFPSDDLPLSPGTNGWWKRDPSDYLWLRDFLQTKYQSDLTDFDYRGGYAISEGRGKLDVKSGQLKKGDLLMARVLSTKLSGNIEFLQSGQNIGPKIATQNECEDKNRISLKGYAEIPDKTFQYDCAKFKWFTAGVLKEDGAVTIYSDGAINIVNALVSVGPQDLQGTEIPSQLNTVKIAEIRENTKTPEVSYKRFSPTHYKVYIKGLEKPSTLVFSESYDLNWKLSGEDPLKVYSLFNGYRVDIDGEYDLSYLPQKYVNYGFCISLLSIFVIGGYLLIKRK